MKKAVTLSLLALCAACTDQRPIEPSAEARSQLAVAVEGREAGPPQDCVSQRDLTSNRSAGEGALIFETRSRNLIYVNRPPAGCPTLDSGRTLISRTPSDRLCRGDIVNVADLVSGTSYGSCGLGDFTPYRRVR